MFGLRRSRVVVAVRGKAGVGSTRVSGVQGQELASEWGLALGIQKWACRGGSDGGDYLVIETSGRGGGAVVSETEIQAGYQPPDHWQDKGHGGVRLGGVAQLMSLAKLGSLGLYDAVGRVCT